MPSQTRPSHGGGATPRATADYNRRRAERLAQRLDVTLQRAVFVSAAIERAAGRIAEAVGDG